MDIILKFLTQKIKNMSVFIVTFGLTANANNSNVITAIKSEVFWVKISDTVWFVKSDKDRVELRESIFETAKIDLSYLMVIDISNSPWATYGVDQDITTWMKKNI